VTTGTGRGRRTDPPEIPFAVPASGDRRRYPAPAHLRFFHGPMDCGKSTLALQVDHNQSRQGRHGLLVTQGDRSAPGSVCGGRPSRSSRTPTSGYWCAGTGRTDAGWTT
jgi:hypothetical protein